MVNKHIVIFLIFISYFSINAMNTTKSGHLGNFFIKQAVGIFASKIFEGRLDGEFYYKAYGLSFPDLTKAVLTEPDAYYLHYINLCSYTIALYPEIALCIKIAKNIVKGEKIYDCNNLELSNTLLLKLCLTLGLDLAQKTTILFADSVFKR